MLQSKATAALMRLKEIDRKYKTNYDMENRRESSLSTISSIDSITEFQNRSTHGSGDTPIIVVPRPKLRIKMPETHVEGIQEKDSTLVVTIFDKSGRNTNAPSKIIVQSKCVVDPVGPAGEGNSSDAPKNESDQIQSRGQSQNTDTSISEVVEEPSRSFNQSPIAVLRPKNNIKKQDTHVKESSTLVVTIFDQSSKNSTESKSQAPSKLIGESKSVEKSLVSDGAGNLLGISKINKVQVDDHGESLNSDVSISEVVEEQLSFIDRKYDNDTPDPTLSSRHNEKISESHKEESSTLLVTIFDGSSKNSFVSSNRIIRSKSIEEENSSDTIRVDSRVKSQNTETTISEVLEEPGRPCVQSPFTDRNFAVDDDVDIEIIVESVTTVNSDSQLQNSVPEDVSSAGYSDESFEASSSSQDSLPAQKIRKDEQFLVAISKKTASSSSSKKYSAQVGNHTEVVPHSRHKAVYSAMESSEKQIVELLAPKAVQTISACDQKLDNELLKYVDDLEMQKSSGNISPVCLPKSVNSCPSRLKKPKKKRQSVRETSRTSPESTLTNPRDQGRSDADHPRRRGPRRQKSSPAIGANDSSELPPPYKHKNFSRSPKDLAPANIAVLLKMKEPKKSNDEKSTFTVHSAQLNFNDTMLLSDKNPQEFGDSLKTSVLRNLNKEALVAVARDFGRKEIKAQGLFPGRHRSTNCTNQYQIYKSSAIQPVPVTRITRVIEDLSIHRAGKSSLKSRGVEESAEQSRSGKKAKVRRCSESRKIVQFGEDEKGLGDMERLRTQFTMLRLRQEREQLRDRVRGYMRLLDHERTMLGTKSFEGSGGREPGFRALYFPKVAEFTQPGNPVACLE